MAAADKDPIVIAGYARTPMGGFQDSLGAVKPTERPATIAVERRSSAPASRPIGSSRS